MSFYSPSLPPHLHPQKLIFLSLQKRIKRARIIYLKAPIPSPICARRLSIALPLLPPLSIFSCSTLTSRFIICSIFEEKKCPLSLCRSAPVWSFLLTSVQALEYDEIFSESLSFSLDLFKGSPWLLCAWGTL